MKWWSLEGGDGRTLVLRWTDGDESRYPHCWLRDNCRCTTCFDQATQRRTVAFHDLDLDATLVDARVQYINHHKASLCSPCSHDSSIAVYLCVFINTNRVSGNGDVIGSVHLSVCFPVCFQNQVTFDLNLLRVYRSHRR